MRWLVILVLILAQQPAKAPKSPRAAEPNNAKSASRTQETKENQQQSTEAAPASVETSAKPESHGHQTAGSNQAATGSQMASEEDRATQRKLTWFTAVLAGVGVLQLFVMFLTWLVYRRQATIMTRQTETTRDTERAWVIANPVENAPVVGFVPSEGAGNLELHLVGVGQRNVVSFSFKSTGNTPARLVEMATLYRKVDRLEDIPKEPSYGERTSLNDLPLVTGDSLGVVQFLEPSAILSKAEADAVWRKEAFLYAFGIVVYRDVYNRLHETRFGFVYHFPLGGDPRQPGFHRELMPAAYNYAT
jgi:hypothetical protein